MKSFNEIAAKTNRSDDPFYTNRGVKVHNLEVSGYQCSEPRTAKVLEMIIHETTNRINRLQQQESAAEVKLCEIKGKIDEEKAKAELLTIQSENNQAQARMAGQGEAEKIKQFLDDLEGKIPDLETRIQVWNTLRRREALKEVSGGNARVFFTPSDVKELKIDTN